MTTWFEIRNSDYLSRLNKQREIGSKNRSRNTYCIFFLKKIRTYCDKVTFNKQQLCICMFEIYFCFVSCRRWKWTSLIGTWNSTQPILLETRCSRTYGPRWECLVCPTSCSLITLPHRCSSAILRHPTPTLTANRMPPTHPTPSPPRTF